jgi:hypothetical protein
MQQRKVDWAASDESSETGFKVVNRIRSDKSVREIDRGNSWITGYPEVIPREGLPTNNTSGM